MKTKTIFIDGIITGMVFTLGMIHTALVLDGIFSKKTLIGAITLIIGGIVLFIFEIKLLKEKKKEEQNGNNM